MTPCVPKKEMKVLCDDLKYIYKANSIEEAMASVQSFVEKYKNNRILLKKFENKNKIT